MSIEQSPVTQRDVFTTCVRALSRTALDAASISEIVADARQRVGSAVADEEFRANFLPMLTNRTCDVFINAITAASPLAFPDSRHHDNAVRLFEAMKSNDNV